MLIGKAFPDYDRQVEYTESSKGSQTLGNPLTSSRQGKYYERFNLHLNYF